MRQQSFRATMILGIEGLQRTLDAPNRAASADHYPPCNLERLSGTDERGGLLRLIFAVAGFAPEQLEIDVAGDQLSVCGEQNGEGSTTVSLSRDRIAPLPACLPFGRKSRRRARDPRKWVAFDRSPRMPSESG